MAVRKSWHIDTVDGSIELSERGEGTFSLSVDGNEGPSVVLRAADLKDLEDLLRELRWSNEGAKYDLIAEPRERGAAGE